jgi:hypothetical protein
MPDGNWGHTLRELVTYPAGKYDTPVANVRHAWKVDTEPEA